MTRVSSDLATRLQSAIGGAYRIERELGSAGELDGPGPDP
jgi:hypothetical protein